VGTIVLYNQENWQEFVYMQDAIWKKQYKHVQLNHLQYFFVNSRIKLSNLFFPESN